jgi:hypothetical protein
VTFSQDLSTSWSFFDFDCRKPGSPTIGCWTTVLFAAAASRRSSRRAAVVAASVASEAKEAAKLARLASASACVITSSVVDGGVVKRPPRSRHLPARGPSSWTNFVCRLLPLLGLRPSSSGAGVASVRVALSRAARIPPLTLVRRSVLGVTKLLRGDTSREDARVAPDSRLGDRARVAGLGILSRPELDAIGLVGGPTPTTSTASDDATSAQAWPPARRPSPPQSSCVS